MKKHLLVAPLAVLGMAISPAAALAGTTCPSTTAPSAPTPSGTVITEAGQTLYLDTSNGITYGGTGTPGFTDNSLSVTQGSGSVTVSDTGAASGAPGYFSGTGTATVGTSGASGSDSLQGSSADGLFSGTGGDSLGTVPTFELDAGGACVSNP